MFGFEELLQKRLNGIHKIIGDEKYQNNLSLLFTKNTLFGFKLAFEELLDQITSA